MASGRRGRTARRVAGDKVASLNAPPFIKRRVPFYEFLDEEGHVIVTAYNRGEKKRMHQQVVGFDEILNPEYYAKENRVTMNHLPPDEAATGFQEIQRGYNREEAILEANRCFHCGHCALCGTCAEICPMDVIAMGEKGPEVVYPKECWHCGGCRINCPCGSVYYEFPLSMLI